MATAATGMQLPVPLMLLLNGGEETVLTAAHGFMQSSKWADQVPTSMLASVSLASDLDDGQVMNAADLKSASNLDDGQVESPAGLRSKVPAHARQVQGLRLQCMHADIFAGIQQKGALNNKACRVVLKKGGSCRWASSSTWNPQGRVGQTSYSSTQVDSRLPSRRSNACQ